MAQETKRTTNHNTIKKWAEARGGIPSVVTKNGNRTDIIRLDFPGYAEENLQEISWGKWFDLFDENELELIYQEENNEGKTSNFNKLVSRDTQDNN